MKLWLRIFYILSSLAAFFIGYKGTLQFPNAGSHSGYEDFGIIVGMAGILFIFLGVGYSLFALGWLKTNRLVNKSLVIFSIPISIIAIISAYFTFLIFSHKNPPSYSPFQVFSGDLVGFALFPFLGLFLFVIWGIPTILLVSGIIKAIKENFSKNKIKK